MGRPLRIDEAGDYHHVTNRGRNRQDTFVDDPDRILFLQPLGDAIDRGYAELHSFVLMNNHVHLLIRSLVDGGLSRTMQLVGSSYTLAFNRKYGFDGSLFKGRFYSKRIDSEPYLMEVPRYIANNPVKAGLVKQPEDYAWSSHATLLDQPNSVDIPLARDIIDEFFNGNIAAFDRFVKARGSTKALRLEEVIDANLSEQSLALSLEQVAQATRRLDDLTQRSPWKRRLRTNLTTHVCLSLQVTPAALAIPNDEPARAARRVLITLLHRCEVASLAELAQAFGFGSKQAVSRAVQRVERSAQRDSELAALLHLGLSIAREAA